MTIYIPYTYLIGWSKLDRWYYGCSYKFKTKMANPNEFWKTYFTSSKIVKHFRNLYGEPDIIQIRKTFDTAEKALEWEAKVILRMKMVLSERFLNQKDTGGNFRNKGGYKHTEKSKENYKKSFTIERKKTLSNLSIINNKNMPKTSRKKAGKNISKTRKENKEKYSGENSPLYGIERSIEDKISISIGTKKAMDDPVLKEHLSKKAKLRCTPEWKAEKSENNKRKICCIKCHREMSKSSLGRHRAGTKCIPV